MLKPSPVAQVLVAQNRHLADRPESLEVGGRCLVTKVDDVSFEGGVILVEGDDDLLAEGSEWMEIKC
jgi:hypothetical protein